MSEAAFFEIFSTHRSEAGFHTMNFFAIWSGYMVAVYLVGEKLSKSFSILISIIYTSFLIPPAAALFITLNTLVAISADYAIHFPESELISTGRSPLGFLAISLIASWLISILFLLQRRKILNWQ